MSKNSGKTRTLFKGNSENQNIACRNSPIAIHQKEANEQHYEVPAEFFKLSLGPKLKYSSCYFETETSTLAEAEVAMLNLYVARSGSI